jgi:hypothetical protein
MPFMGRIDGEALGLGCDFFLLLFLLLVSFDLAILWFLGFFGNVYRMAKGFTG